jgi:hypothetical protein
MKNKFIFFENKSLKNLHGMKTNSTFAPAKKNKHI